MDLGDRLEDISKEKKMNQIQQFKNAAKDYAEQGLEEPMIRELLELDGCEATVSCELAAFASSETPEEFIMGDPPLSFYDVQGKVLQSLREAPIEKFAEYFDIRDDRKYEGITNRILLARDNNSEHLFGEICGELKELVDDLTTQNMTLASTKKEFPTADSFELERELFGVWSINLIRKHAMKEASNQKAIKKQEPLKRSIFSM